MIPRASRYCENRASAATQWPVVWAREKQAPSAGFRRSCFVEACRRVGGSGETESGATHPRSLLMFFAQTRLEPCSCAEILFGCVECHAGSFLQIYQGGRHDAGEVGHGSVLQASSLTMPRCDLRSELSLRPRVHLGHVMDLESSPKVPAPEYFDIFHFNTVPVSVLCAPLLSEMYSKVHMRSQIELKLHNER
jgi:hypothetical protein